MTMADQFAEADKIKLKLRVPYKCTRCKEWFSLLESNAVKDLFLKRDTENSLGTSRKIDGQTWRNGMDLLPGQTSVESSLFHVMMKVQFWGEL